MLCSRSFCLLCMMQSAETDMKKQNIMPWNVKGEIRYEEKQKDAYSIRTYDRSSFNHQYDQRNIRKIHHSRCSPGQRKGSKMGRKSGDQRKSLWGAYAGADSNTIVSNTDSSVTVKSSAAGTDVIAPGTRNSNSGLHITLNGTPEVSTRVYGTIKTQNIYLKKGEYGVMVEAHDVKAEDFANGGNEYYTETGGAYEKATGYMQGAAYYTLENAANIDANYYPVVYSGAKVTGSKTKDSLSEIGQNIANLLADSQPVTGSAGTGAEQGQTIYTVETDAAKIYAPGEDLADQLNNLSSTNITWEWEFEGDDGADTILGALIAGTSKVVVKDQDSNSYNKISVNEGTGLAAADNTILASVKTSFSIELTADQVD